MITNTKPPAFGCCLIALILQLALACSPSRHKIQGDHWVIFPAEQAEEMKIGSWLLSGGQTIDYWTPSEKGILELEDGLANFLKKNTESFDSQKSPVLERLDGYNRQYTGIILDGRKFIYANCLCDDLGIDWETEYVFILDGGDCYFQFKYHVDTGEYFDLQINGEA